MREELDTSFDVEAFEAEAQGELEAKRKAFGKSQGATPIQPLLELVASKMPKHIRDSPKMQRWVSALGEDRPGESKQEREHRLRWLYEELWGR